MAPLVHPLDSFPPLARCLSPPPLFEDRGSSLTRGRRYNYGRWVGFKYSCFHYGMGLLSSVQEEEEEEWRGEEEEISTLTPSSSCPPRFASERERERFFFSPLSSFPRSISFRVDTRLICPFAINFFGVWTERSRIRVHYEWERVN